MTKKSLIVLTLLAVTLTLLLSGCGKSDQDLEGMYVVSFELNGGALDIQTSNVTSKINYAYQPGSHILDPSTYGNYEISRAGYRFTGWYKSADCKENEKWNFSTDTINSETLTLYAGWVKEIVYTFTVCYVDGTETQKLGSYSVSEGAVFEDYRKFAEKRDGFTPTGYFTDAACTTPWDFKTVHPGGETDTDVCVYVNYIPGEWILVDSYTKLVNAIGKGNVYLTADIDCGGQAFSVGDTFRGTFEGNGFKIKNFTVNKFGGALMPSCSIFQTLGSGAKVQNVTFEDVTFRFFDVTGANKIKVAALARDASGCTVSNVSVSGTIQTNYDGELPMLNEAFYEGDATAQVTEFVSNITVEKQ